MKTGLEYGDCDTLTGNDEDGSRWIGAIIVRFSSNQAVPACSRNVPQRHLPEGGVGSYSGSASLSCCTNSTTPVQITNFTLTCDMYMTWRLFAIRLGRQQTTISPSLPR